MPPIIGVIGAADISEREYGIAMNVGRLSAQMGWTIICGGLKGVMEASARGAFEVGGAVIGILPGVSIDDANKFITIPIATNMGHARNAIIAHTAEAIIAIGGGFGTLSEIAIASKLGKPIFSIGSWNIGNVIEASDAENAVKRCSFYIEKKMG